jgi:hypothetical protein
MTASALQQVLISVSKLGNIGGDVKKLLDQLHEPPIPTSSAKRLCVVDVWFM